MPKGKCKFQKVFMEKEEYKSWLKPGSSIYSAKCCIRDKEISVEWGCESALKSHAGGQTHRDNVKRLEDSKKGLSPLFFRKVPAPSSP